MKYHSIILFVLLISNITWAEPSFGGGGGDVIILPDDSVVLADPFLDGGAIQPNNMPPVRSLNPRILQLINLYRSASLNILSAYGGEIANLMNVLGTRQNSLRFYAVQNAEELNLFCAAGGRKIYKLPNGAMAQQVACTAGDETFLIEPLFLKLSLRDQSMLLLHERLTTLRDLNGGKNYSAVARFTTGLNTYLNVYSEQSKKQYRMLTSEEQKNLTEFYIAAEEIEKRNSEVSADSFQWIAHQNGGGRVYNGGLIDESAFISLNSVIRKNSVVGAGSKIINVSNGWEILFNLGSNVFLTNTSVVNERYIQQAQLTLKDGTIVNNSKIEISTNLMIAENQKLINGELLLETQKTYHPKGIVLKPFIKEFSIPEFSFTSRYRFADESIKNASIQNLDELGNGYIITTDFKKREILGSKNAKSEFSNTKVKFIYKNDKRNTDPTKLLVNDGGEIVVADYFKVDEFSICAYELSDEIAKYSGLVTTKSSGNEACTNFQLPK